MRHVLIGLLLSAATLLPVPANAAVSVSIGINVPVYPTMVRIPSYPVYYAPSLHANYFFYDGLYWVFDGSTWYQSPWYNGPWYAVDPYAVPVYVLRVPVRYYGYAPAYFSGWAYDAPPRWGDHWGSSWESRRAGWDQWNRASAPAAAPLPVYQRSYSGGRYPTVTQQAALQTKSYSYQPRESVAKQQFQERRTLARTSVTPANQRVIPAKAGIQATRERAPKQVAQKQAQPHREAKVERAKVPQRPERIQQAERKEQRPQQREKDKAKGRDRDDKG